MAMDRQLLTTRNLSTGFCSSTPLASSFHHTLSYRLLSLIRGCLSFSHDLSHRFPEYMARDFYLTSESYGGHYLPTLAQELVKSGMTTFKGFAVGNPLTWMPYRDYGQYAQYAARQMVPKPMWDQFVKSGCALSSVNASICDDLASQMDVLTEDLDPCMFACGHMFTYELCACIIHVCMHLCICVCVFVFVCTYESMFVLYLCVYVYACMNENVYIKRAHGGCAAPRATLDTSVAMSSKMCRRTSSLPKKMRANINWSID